MPPRSLSIGGKVYTALMRSIKTEFTATAKNERTRKRLPKRLRLSRKSGALSSRTVIPNGSAGTKK